MTFDVEADAQLSNSITTANRNYGGLTSIAIDNSPEAIGLLRFTVTGVAGGVTRATLRLYCRDATTDGPAIIAVSNDWDESAVTWDSWPATAALPNESIGSVAENAFVEIDVTSIVGGNGTFTFQLIGMSSDAVSFTARESAAKTQRPVLEVEFSQNVPTATITPIPTAIASPTAASTAIVGYLDDVYGRGTFAPTAKEGQSKVWYAGGIWWGALFDPVTGNYYISSLDQETHTWTATRAKIDSRNNAKIDTLWDESSGKLYTVAAMARNNAEILVNRFSFEDGVYTLDDDFVDEPLATAGAVDGVVTIAKDSTNTFWVTFVPFSGDKFVFVTHSAEGSDTDWVEPYAISDSERPLRDEEIAVVVGFGDHIGVMWSDQDTDSMRFAHHVNGTDDREWTQETAFSAPGGSDNHINLKTDSEGRVYAAVKTSFHEPDEPLLLLLVRDVSGTWSSIVFSTVFDNQTRPIVVIDERSDTLVYFAADYELEPGISGGRIYFKQVSLDNIQFEPGKGAVVITNDPSSSINNVSSTKQIIQDDMGILILACDDNARRYWHTWLP